ncbi:hypothetical protein [Limnohabitans sp.]|jgi:hypothetical protein|uniref:hypothetical protein n=1 Tax=Limnohabitans sp. TaxID=1907725 RepID=UPI0037C0E6D3
MLTTRRSLLLAFLLLLQACASLPPETYVPKLGQMGIEYNKDLAGLAQRNAQRAGVAERVRIVHGDIFKEDFSKASVVTQTGHLWTVPAMLAGQ